MTVKTSSSNRPPPPDVQAACLPRPGAICGRNRRPQHDQGRLCRRSRSGFAMMLMLTVDPAYEAAAFLGRCDAVGVPGLLHLRMGGAAAPCLRVATRLGLRAVGPWAGGCRCGASRPARAGARRRSQIGVAAGRIVGAQGGSGRARAAAIAPGAGSGIRAALERAGDLPDGAVARLGGGILPGTRRPAGDLRQRPGGVMVGGRDPDHRWDMATWCRSRRSAGWSRRS